MEIELGLLRDSELVHSCPAFIWRIRGFRLVTILIDNLRDTCLFYLFFYGRVLFDLCSPVQIVHSYLRLCVSGSKVSDPVFCEERHDTR